MSSMSLSFTLAAQATSTSLNSQATTITTTMSTSETVLSIMPATSQISPNTYTKSMKTTLLIPIIISTFLLAAALTFLIAYLLIYRRRRHSQQQLHNLQHLNRSANPYTPQSPFVQSPWSGCGFSPMSPEDVGKDRAIITSISMQEAGSGRRTPQEVLGDTTWGKGDLTPDWSGISREHGKLRAGVS